MTPAEIESLDRVTTEVIGVLAIHASNKAAAAKAAWEAWTAAPAYLRAEAPAGTGHTMQDAAKRWRREADWLLHRPQVLLPFEACLVPVHETGDDLPVLAKVCAAGSHLAIVALVIAEA